MRERLRALLARFGDAAFAVALVVAFFLIFTVILIVSFPKGVGLSSEFRPSAGRTGSPGSPPTAAATAEEDWQSALARLSSVKRTVKSKRAGSIVWSGATEGMGLEEQDAIQTFAGSGASIAFERNQEITLGENSLIVIRRSEKDAVTGTRRASVVLLGGEIEGSIAPSAGAPSSVEVLAGNAAATIVAPRNGTTKFRIAATTDDSAVVSVSSGRAEVRVGDRTVTLGPGQAVNVGASGELRGPASLPKAPTLVAPENGAAYASRVLPIEVAFAWKDDGPDRSYRIEIARDAAFRDTIVDRRVPGTAFSSPDFLIGRYYWRVRSVKGPSEGRVAAARTFEVVSDQAPPLLRVEFPEGPLRPGEVVIRGATEPGAKVYIGKTQATVGQDGTFEGSVVLARGVQIVVVEAVDSVGNIAYASQTMAAR